jgi:capsular exopolysaccharide synthesis family protein
LLTSSVSGEGKSFICKNLAVAMAYSGKKTIVLDIDMRRPQIAKLFDINGENVGISDFLNNKATITSIIQKSGLIDELDIISSGKPVPNPSELLERDELNYLLNSLRETYDWIIIDSPPVHLVPDAMVLSRISDITLYVIRQGVTQLAELDFIKELEEQKLLSSTNIIFNGIERLKYGYGYKYTNNSYYSDKSKKGAFHSIFYDFSSRF